MTETTTETTEATGSRAEKAKRTRNIVLTTARQIFTDKGYAETTIRDIATAAGRSTGSVFTHWSTKRDLYFDVFGHWPMDGVFSAVSVAIIKAAAKGVDVSQASQNLWADMTNRNYFDQDSV